MSARRIKKRPARTVPAPEIRFWGTGYDDAQYSREDAARCAVIDDPRVLEAVEARGLKMLRMPRDPSLLFLAIIKACAGDSSSPLQSEFDHFREDGLAPEAIAEATVSAVRNLGLRVAATHDGQLIIQVAELWKQ